MDNGSTHRRAAAAAAIALALGVGAATDAARAEGGPVAPTRGESPALVSLSGGPVVPGGFFTLTIATDGRGALRFGEHRHRALHLSPGALRRVRRELAAAHVARLRRVYVHHGPPLAGAYPDRVTVGARRVTVQPGARAPKALVRLIDDLRGIADQLRG